MIQDEDKKVIENTIDDAFLNEEILLSMGFKFAGSYNDWMGTKVYTYEKEHLGCFEVFIQNINALKLRNNIVPETDIVVVSNVTHPITNDPNVNQRIETRYMLQVRDLKELIKFRRLMAKIHNLQHQAEDMLRDGNISTLRDLEFRVSGFG